LFAAFGIQHAMRVHRVILSVASEAFQYFSTLPHKRHDCRKEDTEHRICVFIFLNLFPKLLPF